MPLLPTANQGMETVKDRLCAVCSIALVVIILCLYVCLMHKRSKSSKGSFESNGSVKIITSTSVGDTGKNYQLKKGRLESVAVYLY